MKIAILLSGSGTTASAVIQACKSGKLTGIEPVLVIASKTDAPGIERVKSSGMNANNVVVINPKSFVSSEEFGREILAEFDKRGVEFICHYGWLRLTPANVLAKYQGMMVNQHAGPLDPGRPDFGGKGMFGLRIHSARIEFVRRTNRDFWSEATAQRVAPNFDEGSVLNASRVDILPNDTPETLQKRMLPAEHEVQIKTLRDFVNGSVTEVKRNAPLVSPEEYQLLEECKRSAILKYPKG